MGRIDSSYKNGVRLLVLNNPRRKNALSTEMILKWADILRTDALDDKIVATVITGFGTTFSSGVLIGDFQRAPVDGELPYEKLVYELIAYPKLLIAVVNGLAVGIAVTILPLCDVVYATDDATFRTPFINLAISPEACSSYTFPRILGQSKAMELLLLGETMTAQEAYNFGFVSKVIAPDKLQEFIDGLYKYGQLQVNTVKRYKKLFGLFKRDKLINVHKTEVKYLLDAFASEEFSEICSKMLAKYSKL